MADKSAIVLRVNGQDYGGWLDLRVKRAMDEFAHSFSFSYADRWLKDSLPLPINEGDIAKVLIDGELLISGYIDESTVQCSATQHSLDVVGRSAAGDLVDCAAVHAKGQWSSATLLQIANDLCKPFGVSVAAPDVPLTMLLKGFTLQPAETVIEALNRAARFCGVLATSDPTGAVRFTRAGKRRTQTDLVRGQNVLGCSRRGSWTNRFSTYTIKAQQSGANDQIVGKDASQQKAVATDGFVTRYRPTIISAEDQVAGTAGLGVRATYECNVRAGRSRTYAYTVQGWECAEGLWQPNTITHVSDPVLGLDDDFLIHAVSFVRSEEGTVTELDLMAREAFDTLNVPPKEKGKRRKGKDRIVTL